MHKSLIVIAAALTITACQAPPRYPNLECNCDVEFDSVEPYTKMIYLHSKERRGIKSRLIVKECAFKHRSGTRYLTKDDIMEMGILKPNQAKRCLALLKNYADHDKRLRLPGGDEYIYYINFIQHLPTYRVEFIERTSF
ncbi:MAG TPA: hypothetical protein DCL21_04030 [Alphaproteobacteria bacterium]|nr:hypothetical protein [Alphaproteobacteria bacterium]